jgi:NitT/TauT family transport system substrate-binding protein
VRQYNEGKTERNLDIIEEATQLDRELLSQSCWPPIHSDAEISVEGMMDFQNWAMEKGYIDRVLSEDEFWDASFVEYASQALDESAQ